MTEVDHLTSQIGSYVTHNESSLSAIGRRRLLEGLPQGNRRTSVSTSSAQTTLSNSNARIRRNNVPHTNVHRAESETVRKSLHFNHNQENHRNMSMHHQEQSFVDELNRSLDANTNVRVSRTRGHESIEDFMVRIQQEQDIRFKQTRRITHLMQSEIDIDTDMILTQDLRVANRYRQGGGAIYDDFDFPVVPGDVHHYGGAKYRYSELDLRGSTESFGYFAPHSGGQQQQQCYDDATIDHSQPLVAPNTTLPQQRTQESIPTQHVQATLHAAVSGMGHSRDGHLTDVPVVHANRGDAATSKLEKEIMEKRKSRMKSLHYIDEHLQQVEQETVSHHVEALPDVNALHEQTRRHEQQRGSLHRGHIDAQHVGTLHQVGQAHLAAPTTHYASVPTHVATTPLSVLPDTTTSVTAVFNSSIPPPVSTDHRAVAQHDADKVLQAARAVRNERLSSMHEKMAAVDSVNTHVTAHLHEDAGQDKELAQTITGTAPETTAPATTTTHATTASSSAEQTLAANREARKQRLAHIAEQVHAVEEAHVSKKDT